MQLEAEEFPPVYIKFPHTEIRGERAILTAVVTAVVFAVVRLAQQ